MRSRAISRGGGSAAARIVLLVVFFMDAVPDKPYAHQDPPNCGAARLTLSLFVYFADGTNSPGAGGAVTPCEMLVYKGYVAIPESGSCAFEGGQLIILTPDGEAHDATPDGGIPKLGGTGGL